MVMTILAGIWLLNVSAGMEGRAFVVQKNSSMTINGSSNINEFSCEIENTIPENTVYTKQVEEKARSLFSGTELKIPVKEFNCGNPYITRDFMRELQVERFPFIKVIFKETELFPSSLDRIDAFPIPVEIVLRGVSHPYTIRFAVENRQNGLQLMGTKTVAFSDFAMAPPQKFFGLIKVNEFLRIDFRFLLKPLNSVADAGSTSLPAIVD